MENVNNNQEHASSTPTYVSKLHYAIGQSRRLMGYPVYFEDNGRNFEVTAHESVKEVPKEKVPVSPYSRDGDYLVTQLKGGQEIAGEIASRIYWSSRLGGIPVRLAFEGRQCEINKDSRVEDVMKVLCPN